MSNAKKRDPLRQPESISLQPRLERIRAALGARDWVGIGIEMIVVMLGVLLAFRIEQWGQSRTRAVEERQFIERLYRENARAIAEAREITAFHRDMASQMRTALSHQNDPEALRRLSKIEGYACWPLFMPAAPYNDTASEELIGSGKLSLISDPKLRLSLRELASAQAFGAKQLESSREIARLFFPYLRPYYQLSLGSRAVPDCYGDWPALMQNQAARNDLLRLYRTHARLEVYRRAQLIKAEEAQTALACALRSDDCKAQ